MTLASFSYFFCFIFPPFFSVFKPAAVAISCASCFRSEPHEGGSGITPEMDGRRKKKCNKNEMMVHDVGGGVRGVEKWSSLDVC